MAETVTPDFYWTDDELRSRGLMRIWSDRTLAINDEARAAATGMLAEIEHLLSDAALRLTVFDGNVEAGLRDATKPDDKWAAWEDNGMRAYTIHLYFAPVEPPSG